MKIKGTCTAIDYRTVSFVLDENITIFAIWLFIEQKELILPAIGDVVEICNGEWIRRNEVYLNILSTLTIIEKHFPPVIDLTQSKEDLEIGQMITDTCIGFGLSPNKIDYIYQTIKRINNLKAFPLGEKLNEQIVHRFTTEYLVINLHIEKYILQFGTPGILVKIPSDIYEESSAKNLFKPIELSRRHTRYNECMIGLLHVYHHTGVLLLTDYQHSMPIVILCKKPAEYSEKLKIILNKYVWIENYYVLKEEYSTIRKYKYIVVHIDDIYVLADGLSPPPTIPTQNNEIVVIHFQYRCSVTRNLAGKASCLTFAKLNFEDRERYWFLRLEGNHLDTYPMVNEHDVYKLHCSKKFIKRLKDVKKDMSYQVRTDTSIPCFILPADSRLEFCENKELGGPMVWKTVEDICEVIEDSSMAVYSFEAIITNKLVASLRPLERPTCSDFSLPVSNILLELINVPPVDRIGYDEKLEVPVTYAEQFETYEELGNKKQPIISLVLHQWNNKHFPLGLVPDMRVRLLNWIPNRKKTGLIPCHTSSIIPIDYPRTNYIAGEDERNNWGDPWPLGYGLHVPFGTICWGQTETIFIRSLTFTTECERCWEEVVNGYCVACKNFDPEFVKVRGKILLYVKDVAGKYDVLSSNMNVIRVLLDLEADKDWFYIMTCIKGFSPFQFKYSDECRPIDQTDNESMYTSKLVNQLITHLKNININSTDEYDLKCRRIDKDREKMTEDDSQIQWYCLAARVTELPVVTARYGEKNSKRVWV